MVTDNGDSVVLRCDGSVIVTLFVLMVTISLCCISNMHCNNILILTVACINRNFKQLHDVKEHC